MKRGLIVFALFLFSMSFIFAKCDLGVSLINQDPYPAVPGDYVKLLFQVTGTENPDCSYVSLELLEQYPISFDPGTKGFVQVKGGTFEKDYSSSLVVPFKVRIDPNALDGDNPVEVRYGSVQNLTQYYFSKLFNVNVKDVRADFEVFVKDYVPGTNTLTLEILNIADSDVQSLTIQIPEQPNVKLLGAGTNIVGDLNSNDYTTADFTLEPKQGEIKLNIFYNDEINKRRTIEKSVYINPSEFTSNQTQQVPWYFYLILILILAAIVYYFYRRRKKKKERIRKQRRGMARLG